MQSVDKICVVCGLVSSRSDWQSSDTPACDSHTKAEIKEAMKAKGPQVVPAAEAAK